MAFVENKLANLCLTMFCSLLKEEEENLYLCPVFKENVFILSQNKYGHCRKCNSVSNNIPACVKVQCAQHVPDMFEGV